MPEVKVPLFEMIARPLAARFRYQHPCAVGDA
jgi:hypothetical protein